MLKLSELPEPEAGMIPVPFGNTTLYTIQCMAPVNFLSLLSQASKAQAISPLLFSIPKFYPVSRLSLISCCLTILLAFQKF